MTSILTLWCHSVIDCFKSIDLDTDLRHIRTEILHRDTPPEPRGLVLVHKVTPITVPANRSELMTEHPWTKKKFVKVVI